MFPDYGVDFQIQLFNNDPASIVNGIQASLQTKLQKYLPQVKITNISVLSLDIQNHFLSLQFQLSITPTNTIAYVNYST